MRFLNHEVHFDGRLVGGEAACKAVGEFLRQRRHGRERGDQRHQRDQYLSGIGFFTSFGRTLDRVNVCFVLPQRDRRPAAVSHEETIWRSN